MTNFDDFLDEQIENMESQKESEDPFYREANMKHLDEVIKGIEDGTRPLVEHELIEVEEKDKRNAEYMKKIDESLKQLSDGSVVVKTMEELEAFANCTYVDGQEQKEIEALNLDFENFDGKEITLDELLQGEEF